MKTIVTILLLFVSAHIYAQQPALPDPLGNARSLAIQKKYDEAIEAYKILYKQNPGEADVYNEYLDLLLNAGQLKQAEDLAEGRKKMMPGNPLPYIDMGRVYVAMQKDKKAVQEFDASLKAINGDDNLTRAMAKRFVDIGKPEYAIKAYENTRALLRAPNMYTGPLSRLYAEKGDIEQAILMMLEPNMGYTIHSNEDTKAGLQDILGNDARRLVLAQKALIKRINEQPENPYYAELLTWLYTQKNDWEGAMLQVIALDERNKEQGSRLLEFARYAAKNDQFDIAIKSFDEVIGKGKTLPYYSIASNEKLAVQFAQLQDDPSRKKEDGDKLTQQYEKFLAENHQYSSTETVRDYAELVALYVGDHAKAITILENAIALPNISKYLYGESKLQLGDYYTLAGRVWDASLMYSQVDKAFREDVLGEEARFRNAKLAYYRGDFEWAQGQLTVLKASTSELIANDALYLSILITENITPDSNFVPIRRFAYADLLLFQNKDKEAELLLDSINANFPQHPLRDDILMKKADLAQKHRDYAKALTSLEEIYKKYGKDVLGDDAVFKTANIYDKFLKQPAEAKKYYEMLILDYPGSTYIQTARNRLSTLQTGSPVYP